LAGGNRDIGKRMEGERTDEENERVKKKDGEGEEEKMRIGMEGQ